jgi:hypothetical protein
VAKDRYDSNGVKMTVAGVSTTSRKLWQLSASSPATMKASDSARVASETAMGVDELMTVGVMYL